MASLEELHISRSSALNNTEYEYTQQFRVDGAADPTTAMVLLEAQVEPLVIGTRFLYKKDIRAKLVSLQKEVCEGVIVWSTARDLIVVEHDGTPDTELVTLSMVGESTTIKFVENAADADHYYDDLGLAIGKNPDGTIEGTTVEEPTEELLIKIWVNAATVNPTYRSALRNIYYHVNDNTWKGYGAGNLLFTGVTYGDVVNDLRPLTFQFKARPAVTLQPDIIGTVPGGQPNPPTINKRGWDYYWVQRGVAFDVSPGNNVRDEEVGVKSAHLDRVYPEADFSTGLPLNATKLFPTDP